MKILNVPILSALAMAGLACVQGQGSLLWLGPGLGTSSKSEVFTLPSEGSSALGNSACSIPVYPITDIYYTVGFINNDGLLTICGGYSHGSPRQQATCYSLKNSIWSSTSTMNVARVHAAAIILTNGSAVVAGGYSGDGRLKSTELLSEDGVWHIGEYLPSPNFGHCMLQLSTGQIFLNGGYDAGDHKQTYLATNYGSAWGRKAAMKKVRYHHTCTEMTSPQQIWVGGGHDVDSAHWRMIAEDSVEIYTPETDSWADGPTLPFTSSYSGVFTNYLSTIIYSGGKGIKDVYMLNSDRDGWTRIGEMTQARYLYPALVISEDNCYGILDTTTGEKDSPMELSYTVDATVGYLAGSLFDLDLFSQSSEEISVSCCSGGSIASSKKICGKRTSCLNICGEFDTGCATIECEEFHDADVKDKLCSANMQGVGWCKKASVISELTNDCAAERMALAKVYDLAKPTNEQTSECTDAGQRKKRDVRTARSANIHSTPVFNIWYCTRKCRHVSNLGRMPECCLHPYTRRGVPGVIKKCCVEYGFCV